jgi:uncharacterized LabA/DUF88 family protein
MTVRPRIALFIDAENASPSHIEAFLELCRTLGKLTIARCYGSVVALKGWDAAVAKHHLVPVQTPSSASKANASDFALTIDAVSLLHRNLFDHAVIASSDADFTLLAVHIREHGKGIDGIGEAKARSSLKLAFDNFTLLQAKSSSKPATKITAKPVPKSESKSEPRAVARKVTAKPIVKIPTHAAVDAEWLKDIFHKARKDAEFADLQSLGRALAAANSGYKKGHRTLDNFLRKSGLFEIRDKNVYLLKPSGA